MRAVGGLSQRIHIRGNSGAKRFSHPRRIPRTERIRAWGGLTWA